ncbi:MAG: hypothetical protein KAI72_06810 [Candidatus Pacebacteria bacterium]|nr:hypothetical protein [Candidatus Paceibacterota bacterium]
MKTLNQTSGMPKINCAFAGWQTNISVLVITQEIIDGFATDFEKTIEFKGVIQPLSPRKIMLKPEGQRAFEWLQVFCASMTLILKPNDKIIYNEKRYKLMADNDYSQSNFKEYHIIRDYMESP